MIGSACCVCQTPEQHLEATDKLLSLAADQSNCLLVLLRLRIDCQTIGNPKPKDSPDWATGAQQQARCTAKIKRIGKPVAPAPNISAGATSAGRLDHNINKQTNTTNQQRVVCVCLLPSRRVAVLPSCRLAVLPPLPGPSCYLPAPAASSSTIIIITRLRIARRTADSRYSPVCLGAERQITGGGSGPMIMADGTVQFWSLDEPKWSLQKHDNGSFGRLNFAKCRGPASAKPKWMHNCVCLGGFFTLFGLVSSASYPVSGAAGPVLASPTRARPSRISRPESYLCVASNCIWPIKTLYWPTFFSLFLSFFRSRSNLPVSLLINFSILEISFGSIYHLVVVGRISSRARLSSS